MSVGHVAVARPPGRSGLACLLPWGAAAARVLRMLGLNPAANISRNAPEGWSQCYVGEVASIQCEKPQRGDVLCVCVKHLAWIRGLSCHGLRDECSPGLTRTGWGWKSGSVTNGPTCTKVQCLEKETQKRSFTLYLGSSQP